MAIFVLTGGIGSGKSSVLGRLVERGAKSIDADRIVADLQEPDERVFSEIVDRFGPGVVGPDGRLDRPELSRRVFTDKAELESLEKIVHPAVRRRIKQMVSGLQAHNGLDATIVIDIPLVTSRVNLYGAVGVIVVDCPYPEAIRRLTSDRGMSAENAQRRISNQIPREQRLALADFVLDNAGSIDDLEEQVSLCWSWMVRSAIQ